jgi:hypothetical protein
MPAIVQRVRLLTPDEIARAVVRGIERERRTVVVPAMMRAMLAVDRIAPRLVERVLIHGGWTRAAHPPRRPD